MIIIIIIFSVCVCAVLGAHKSPQWWNVAGAPRGGSPSIFARRRDGYDAETVFDFVAERSSFDGNLTTRVYDRTREKSSSSSSSVIVSYLNET